ncbi:MAG: hypothetical protein P8130_09650 [Deltaproteobacteria bacterium]
MGNAKVTKKTSYDFYLILATVAVLFVISVICVYGMFYFKWAQIQQMPPALKMQYMDRMNLVVSPFVIALILVLSICVPKRLLPVEKLNWFALFLVLIVPVVAIGWGVEQALLVVLLASLLLQVVVLSLALLGSQRLNFEKSGYWLRVGSSLIHLGIILFILDLFLFRLHGLHLVLFWLTTGATVLGMIFSFYSQGVASLLTRKKQDRGIL